ncbi:MULTISPECIES: hypothetical protein [unclassified Imperialibacter]|uniref:hypothetical protein n=1 Tax=unclassified Imperialibacter TaxID=2629706 RepID=UPI00125EA3CA|nr:MULTISPECIES: hypothetical protein [unclassified Imperialibacter]
MKDVFWSRMEAEKHIDNWLNVLAKEQQQARYLGLPLGCVPSVRSYPILKISRNDPNVFFPALIASKLQEWKHLMSSSQTERADKIVAGIVDTFPLYKSRRGRMHYNFWPTNPDIPFPNGKVLHRFDFFRLPDDIDDTALVYSALSSDKPTVLSLQQDIDEHFLRHYPKQPRMYAAWLGDKMPWVVDACAMINLLSLFQHHKLLPTAFTGTSEAYLKDIILTKSYIKTPYEVAPYYPDSAVIAYHLAKWLSGDREKLEHLIAVFVSDIEALLATEWNDFKAMLYAISLLKLGVRPLREIELYRLEGDSYPWFYGSMLSAVKPSWLQKMGRFRLFHIAHSCPPWNHTLWVEYTLLKKMIEKRNIIS